MVLYCQVHCEVSQKPTHGGGLGCIPLNLPLDLLGWSTKDVLFFIFLCFIFIKEEKKGERGRNNVTLIIRSPKIWFLSGKVPIQILSKRVFGKAELEPEHSKVQGSSSKNVVPSQAECHEMSTEKV
jgi:hypothetical protein